MFAAPFRYLSGNELDGTIGTRFGSTFLSALADSGWMPEPFHERLFGTSRNPL